MTEVDCAWVAGLLEGEGAFFVTWKDNTNGRKYPAFRVACNMTDGDVLQRLLEITGLGILKGPYNQSGLGHKPFYRWYINKRADVESLLVRILPYMGRRRSARIMHILSVMRDYPAKARWRHGTRWGYEVGCRCDECRSAHAARHREMRARRKKRRMESCPMQLEMFFERN